MRSMPRPPLSVTLITLNEEANLARCLESVSGFVDEIVVVDSGSTDATAAIAARFGARWIENPWPGFREQKNVSLDHCTHDWVLCLDADEALSDELRTSIRHFFEEGGAERCGGVEFARCSSFMGRWIRHGDWYPDRVLRLFRRSQGRWDGTSEHTSVEVTGRIERIAGDLYHWPFPTMRRFVEKQLVYVDAFGIRSKIERRNWSLFANLLRPLWRFLRGYFLKAGFLDGFPGLWIAVGNAYTTFLRYSKLRE